jgi:hypothetical protein
LLALLVHDFLHVIRIRVKSLTLRWLMSYIYIYIYIYIWTTYSWCLYIRHNDAAQSVGLLWTSDQLVAGRSPTEILGSNPTGGMDICLLWVSCVVR